MVPSGLLQSANAFNFIFRACRRCNAEKAQIEDRVSAITLLTSPGREDPSIDAEARRKAASSFDQRRRKPVANVSNEFRINFGGVLSFNLRSPAQLDPADEHLLAFRHIQGLFTVVASLDPTRRETTRILPEKHFGLFGSWPYRDWGNHQLLEISRRAYTLSRIGEITSADGFFRAALRRQAEGHPWFWALEWNQNLRLAGWIGAHGDPPEIFRDLPPLEWRRLDAVTRVRQEIPLSEDAEDLLFDPVVDG